MGTYINSLDQTQKDNLALVAKAVREGVSNPYTQAAILAIVAKESGFRMREETSYATTSNDRIRAIFGKRLQDLSEDQLTTLKKNPPAFFEKVYGMYSGVPLGNNQPGDGYKYRGRGFNQLTGRGNYKFYGEKIGVDLEKNPELLNNPEIAAKALVMYFRISAASKANKLKEWNASNLNDFKTLQDSVGGIFHANAGWGKSKQAIEGDPTGGFKKASDYAPEFLEYVGGEKKNGMSQRTKILLIILILILLWYFLLHKNK